MADWKRKNTFSATGQPYGHTSADIPEGLLRLAERLQQARSLRSRHFDQGLFGEPGWDMLLAVYVAHGRGYRINVTDVCFESRSPQTTALRWLDVIEQAGLVARRVHAVDRRSTLVGMTPSGVERTNLYLHELAELLSRDRSETPPKADWQKR